MGSVDRFVGGFVKRLSWCWMIVRLGVVRGALAEGETHFM